MNVSCIVFICRFQMASPLILGLEVCARVVMCILEFFCGLEE